MKCQALFFHFACLTGQNPYLAKYEILFPGWFHQRGSNSVRAILSFNIGRFPFTYLRVLISHRKLSVTHFNSLIEKVNKVVAS